MTVPNRAHEPARKVDYDAARGVGTYSPITSGDVARAKEGVPGVGQLNTRATYERRAGEHLPGFSESSNPWTTMRDTPGSGQA